MNLVDVSEETLNREYNSLLVNFNIDPFTMSEATNATGSPSLATPEMVDQVAAEDLTKAKAETVRLVRPIIEKPLKLFFEIQCPNWQVSDDEISELGDAYTALFAKHFPMFYQNPYVAQISNFIDDIGEEIKCLRVTFAFRNRYKDTPRKIEEVKPDKKKADDPAPVKKANPQTVTEFKKPDPV